MNEPFPPVPAAVLAAAKATLSTIGGCALLIGVEDYSTYDATGGHDLLAGRNDVLAYWKVCRRLGYKPEHIRVLTSPKLTEQALIWAEIELSPELSPKESEAEVAERVKGWLSGEQPRLVLKEATSSTLKEGAEWLAERLVFTVRVRWENRAIEEEWAALPGFLSYSGHGAQLEGDLALCPSDVGPNLENAVSFTALREIFDKADDIPGGLHPTDNLTVVLDCCFAGAGDQTNKAQRVPTLTRGSPAPKASVAQTEIGSRVFCASARDERSYQAMLGGYWYSAFTWAFTVALEQWKMEQEGQYKRSTISHTELLFRARMLLKALSFGQHPMLVDKIGNLPVFHHDSARQGGDETSTTPNAERRGGQIDPSGRGYAYYQLLVDGTPILEIIVTNTAGYDFARQQEYWRIKMENVPSAWGTWNGNAYCTDAFANSTLSKEIRDWPAGASDLPFQASQKSFQVAVAAEWTTNLPDRRQFQCIIGHGLRINVWSPTAGRWSGTVEWIRSDGDATPLFGGDGRSFALSSQSSDQLPGSTSGSMRYVCNYIH